MIKVYDMASGDLLPAASDENYGDETLHVATQPQARPAPQRQQQLQPQLRLEIVAQETPVKICIPEDLADIDCESFISSQTAK